MGRPLTSAIFSKVVGVLLWIPARQRQLLKAFAALAEHARHFEAGLVVHNVSIHRRAVEVALHRARSARDEALRRPSGRARVHRLMQELAHLSVLVIRRHATALRFLDAHDVAHQRIHRHVREQVDALGSRVERVHELRIALPVELHRGLHRAQRNRLGADHREHRAFGIGGANRREAETAIAEHHRSHAVITGDSEVRIPENLGIVVGVQVDESGRDDLSVGIHHLGAFVMRDAADLRDAAVLDSDVAAEARRARSVDDHSVFND